MFTHSQSKNSFGFIFTAFKLSVKLTVFIWIFAQCLKIKPMLTQELNNGFNFTQTQNPAVVTMNAENPNSFNIFNGLSNMKKDYDSLFDTWEETKMILSNPDYLNTVN